MEWGSAAEIERQAQDGVKRGYQAYYIKAGVNERREEEMLEALRGSIGPQGKIRIDVNQAWNIPQAARLLNRWHARFDLDFDLPDQFALMRRVRAQVLEISREAREASERPAVAQRHPQRERAAEAEAEHAGVRGIAVECRLRHGWNLQTEPDWCVAESEYGTAVVQHERLHGHLRRILHTRRLWRIAVTAARRASRGSFVA